ncbi:MAG: hypothetical protein GY950_05765 [bacterium]|nr:hypothetical protein [bacterium]
MLSYGQKPTACRHCGFCLKTIGDKARVLYQTGYFYENAGLADEAVTFFEKATEIETLPETSHYQVSSYFHLAKLYNPVSQKCRVLRACLELAPRHKKAKEMLTELGGDQ